MVYTGKTYHIVKIGSQYWLKENSYCTCHNKYNPTPPPPQNLVRNGSVIGTVDFNGVIRSPGSTWDGQKIDPFGHIPGAGGLKVGPAGIIQGG